MIAKGGASCLIPRLVLGTQLVAPRFQNCIEKLDGWHKANHEAGSAVALACETSGMRSRVFARDDRGG